MKKIFSLMLASALMAFALTGCGSSNNDTSSTAETSAVPEATADE